MNRAQGVMIAGMFSALAIGAGAGCSSGNDATDAGSSGTPGVDASPMGNDAGGVSPDTGAVAETGAPADAACTKMGDLAAVDAGCQWSCIMAACATQATACEADCPCNNAVIQALACQAMGGNSFVCFGAALVDSTATALLTCSQGANAQCASQCGSDAPND